MTGISRSTSSLQINPQLAGLLLAALRLRLYIEGEPRLPFENLPQPGETEKS